VKFETSVEYDTTVFVTLIICGTAGIGMSCWELQATSKGSSSQSTNFIPRHGFRLFPTCFSMTGFRTATLLRANMAIPEVAYAKVQVLWVRLVVYKQFSSF